MGKTKEVLNIVGEDIDDTAQKYATMLNGIWDAGTEDEAADGTSRIEMVARLLKEAREAAGQAGGDFRALGKDWDKAGKEAQKAADNIRNQISALEVAADTWGMAAGEVKLYTLEQEGATETQIDYARSLIETVENLELSKRRMRITPTC